MEKIKEKLFAQPTRIGTKIYAYDRYDRTKIKEKVYDIVYYNHLENKEELLKCMVFESNEEDGVIEKIVIEEVNSITDIFDIGLETGQRLLKQKFNDLLK